MGLRKWELSFSQRTFMVHLMSPASESGSIPGVWEAVEKNKNRHLYQVCPMCQALTETFTCTLFFANHNDPVR